MPFRIIRNDITKVRADAIVNTANPEPVIGGGTDSAIYEAAGAEKLLEARRKIGTIEPGQAAWTEAYGLQARVILHTVGPVWIDGQHREREVLHQCYANALALAEELHCESIAFPLIATGVYGFPKDEALSIALGEISRFLLSNEMMVSLVVFDEESFVLSSGLFHDIEELIDDQHVSMIRQAEYAIGTVFAASDEKRFSGIDRRRTAILQGNRSRQKQTKVPEQSLEELLDTTEDTFQKRLFRLIDQKQLDDVTVYKKANIDRKVFSKIRCNEDYKPKKRTALAFAIALELDMPSTVDLLARAGLSFSPSSKFDLIVGYFISHENYSIYDINAALFKYGQPILGDE